MAFVILCVIAGLVAAAWFIFWLDEGIGFGLAGAFLGIMLTGIIGGGIFMILFGTIPANDKTEPGGSEHLQAIGTGSTITGRFFLGTGYVNGERTLNFIAHQDDGGFRVDDAKAYASVVFEGADDPTVTYTYHSYSNGWILPWDFRTGTTYRFDVPAGSVLENYTIDNG